MPEQKRIQSLARALDILEAISFGLLSLTELSKAVKLHKATAFQLVSTLESRGYVSKDPKTKQYSLGLKIATLNESLWQRNSLKLKAKPCLRNLSRITEETTHLALYENGLISIIDVELSSGNLIVNSEVGEKAVAHSSAVGKAILAFLPEEAVDRILSQKLPKFTSKTITSKQKLKNQLAQVCVLGYAVDDEETYLGIKCIASPVLNKNGVVEGAIGISGPSVRIKQSKIRGLGKIVVEIAEKLSADLGYCKCEEKINA